MRHSPFQPTQREFMKHVFVFFTIILALFPEVYAEDDKWIDGIIYTYGQSHSGAYISYEGSTIMRTIDKFDDQENYNLTILSNNIDIKIIKLIIEKFIQKNINTSKIYIDIHKDNIQLEKNIKIS